jgi:HEPN domain-containing protein
MSARRFPPDDPREWLNRARSSLAKAAAADIPEVYREDLCFDAQQAAEKALKAVLLWGEARFAYTHDLAYLLSLVEQAGLELPPAVRRAAILSDYAVQARYPGVAEPVTQDEYAEALEIARTVIAWAEDIVARGARGMDEHCV